MMYHPNEVARRARIASFVLMGMFFFLSASFFRTQVIDYKHYALLSDANRLRAIAIPAQRGMIYDRNNQIIAEDLPGYKVSLYSSTPDSLRLMLERLATFIPISPREIDRLANRRPFSPAVPTVVLSDASYEEVAVLEEHKVIDLPGLWIESAPKRSYPDGKSVAAITGYLREITESELALTRYKDYRQDQQVGVLGLEEQYESTLAGVDGKRWLEVNASNSIVRDEGVRPVLDPQPGSDLYTNIDLDLQRFVADSVFGDNLVGGALAMNPETGEVLALHSGPSFDPNEFIGGIGHTEWDTLNNDPRRPMYNKVTKGKYNPASTFKLAIAIMGLEAGVVSLTDKMPTPCRGSILVGNRLYKCWKTEGHGDITMAEAIQGSCNVFFFQLGQRIGFSRLLAGGVNLGFAEKSGIDLPGETKPTFFPTTDYYDRQYGANSWTAESETVNLAIGQGAVTETVANMAKFYTALASDGWAARPQLIKGTPPERTQIFHLTPEQNLGVREALASVVTSGTAAASRISGLAVAGKTGTAQHSGKGVAHAWFIGFAPVEKPRLLVAVLIEYGEHGSVAAQKASKIFSHYFRESNIHLMETGG